MFLEVSQVWLYIVACTAIIVVPGPTVTVIVANSLRAGPAAGLLNVLGTQIGLLLMLAVLVLGFSTIVESLSILFEVIRIVGALYLIWLGWRMLRSSGQLLSVGGSGVTRRSAWAYTSQGFLVIWSNPKALLFFGAFLPQFVDSNQPIAPQLVSLGFIFMLVGAVFDGAYAVAAGRAGQLLGGASGAKRVAWIERLSGSCLILGGSWLLLRRSA